MSHVTHTTQVVHEVLGSYVFRDEANGLTCTVDINPSKALPSDAFTGAIQSAGVCVCVCVCTCVCVWYVCVCGVCVCAREGRGADPSLRRLHCLHSECCSPFRALVRVRVRVCVYCDCVCLVLCACLSLSFSLSLSLSVSLSLSLSLSFCLCMYA